MGRSLAVTLLVLFSASATAEAGKERAAIISIEMGAGVQDFFRGIASTQVAQGLTAAGYEVLTLDQTTPKLTGELAGCRNGPCLAKVAKALDVTALVTVTLQRKTDSTVIVMRLVEPQTGDALADIHEVCDLCGQDELEERIGVAASALRAKAVAQFAKRGNAAPQPAPTPLPPTPSGPLRVAIVPGIAVNLDTARVDSLSQDLASALNAELDVQATGGLEVRRRLPADGLPADCVTNKDCAADVARRTGASQLLFVVMVDSGAGGSIQIDTTWVEPATNRSASRPAIDLTSASEAKEKFASAAPQLLPDAPVRVKATGGGGGGFNPTLTEGKPRHITTPAMITAAVGVVGLGAGIAFGLSTRSRYDACDGDPAHCDNAERDTIRTRGILADVGFGLALGAAIATTVLYMTSEESPRLLVAPASGGATAAFVGRF
jgi:hypothetical protein